jgi:hypothetical protein
MGDTQAKTVNSDEVQEAEKRDDAVSNTVSLKDESILDKARLLGATPDEIVEAEEYGRTLDLEEAKKVKRIQLNFWSYVDGEIARRNSHLLP